MNKIEEKIREEDMLDVSRERKSSSLAHLKNACPFSTTFIHSIPIAKQKEIETELKQAFELWANSYIAPICRKLVYKGS